MVKKLSLVAIATCMAANLYGAAYGIYVDNNSGGSEYIYTAATTDEKMNIQFQDLLTLMSQYDQNTLGYAKAYTDLQLSNYYTKTESDANFATKTYVEGAISAMSGGTNFDFGISNTIGAGQYNMLTNTSLNNNIIGANNYFDASSDSNANGNYNVLTNSNRTHSFGNFNELTNSNDSFLFGTNGKLTGANNSVLFVSSLVAEETRNDVFNIGGRRLVGLLTPIDGNDAATKKYVDDTIGAVDLSSYYDKTVSDGRFASKTDTYTKAQVDTAISSIPGTDLSSYDTSAQVDTKVATGLTSAKSYADTQDTTTLTSAKSYADTNFASKANTYTKTEVDTLVSGATGADLSGFYTSAQIDTNFYNKTQIDTKFNNYYTRTDVNSMITTAQAEAVHEARLYIESSKLDAIQQSKTYTDDKVANLVPASGNIGVDKTYVDTSSATAQTTAVSSAKSYTDNKATETLNSANSYTDSKIAVVGARISQQEADALNASATEVSLTKTSSVTGNVHGVTVTDTQTTITGGTTSTQITLNDDTVDFKHVQTGNAVRLTGVADGINDTDAANVRQVNSARDEAISSSNSYTDREIGVAKKEAAQGTALALALGTPMNFERGNNAMNIGSGYYHGEKAISLVIGKRVNENVHYTIGVATAGQGATAVKTSVGFNW